MKRLGNIWVAAARSLSVLFIVVSSASLANEPFKILRSQVVTLTEPDTGRAYPFYIKLPRSYAKKAKKRYPVVYLMDAPYSFPIASGATRYPMNSGAMQEAILVGIAYERGLKGPASRVRDFTPVRASDWKLQTGNAAGHAAFIQNIIFPHIEKNYRTDNKTRTFVGNSLGGLFGAYILLSQPDMFTSYILGSPSVWFKDDYLLSLSATTTDAPVKVFIGVGSLETRAAGEKHEMVTGAKQLAQKIREIAGNNMAVKLQIVEGARHSTAFPTTLTQGLDWIYGQSR